jgi:hypothetical protein
MRASMCPPLATTARIYVDSFAVAMWMYAQGYRPLSAGLDPATGRTKFIFPGEAQSAYESYNTAKSALNGLATTGAR